MRFFLLALSFVFVGCGNLEQTKREFVKKYNHENFDDFRGTSIFLRRWDRNGHYYLMYFWRRPQKRPYVLTVNIADSSIAKISYDWIEDSSRIDKDATNKLLKKFFRYRVAGLEVDSTKNVFVNFNSEANDGIVRISDQRFFEHSRKSWWTNITGDWFENKKVSSSTSR